MNGGNLELAFDVGGSSGSEISKASSAVKMHYS